MSEPLPITLPFVRGVNPARRYKWACPNADDSIGHTVVEFVWDGVFDPSDQASCERNHLWKQLAGRLATCRGCGNTLRGVELGLLPSMAVAGMPGQVTNGVTIGVQDPRDASSLTSIHNKLATLERQAIALDRGLHEKNERIGVSDHDAAIADYAERLRSVEEAISPAAIERVVASLVKTEQVVLRASAHASTHDEAYLAVLRSRPTPIKGMLSLARSNDRLYAFDERRRGKPAEWFVFPLQDDPLVEFVRKTMKHHSHASTFLRGMTSEMSTDGVPDGAVFIALDTQKTHVMAGNKWVELGDASTQTVGFDEIMKGVMTASPEQPKVAREPLCGGLTLKEQALLRDLTREKTLPSCDVKRDGEIGLGRDGLIYRAANGAWVVLKRERAWLRSLLLAAEDHDVAVYDTGGDLPGADEFAAGSLVVALSTGTVRRVLERDYSFFYEYAPELDLGSFNTIPVQLKEKTMTTPEASLSTRIATTVRHDATDAAWRTAGRQFVRLAREPLVAMLSRHLAPGDEAVQARIAAFLGTEMGEAALSGLLSLALLASPAAAGEVPQRLAQELRVSAMAGTGDLIAEVVMGPLRQMISSGILGDALAKMPAVEAPAVRVVMDGGAADVGGVERIDHETVNNLAMQRPNAR